MIVKTLQPTKELEQIFDLILKGNSAVFFDYHGSLFEVKPKNNFKTDSDFFEKYQKRERSSFADDSIFNEQDSAQEKANFRNLKNSKYNLDD
jgi:hypothetical protein